MDVHVEDGALDRVVLLLAQEGDLAEGGDLVPVDVAHVLLQDPVGGELALGGGLVDTPGDVGTHYVAIQRNKQLSGIVSIVLPGWRQPSWPRRIIILTHHHQLITERTLQTPIGRRIRRIANDAKYRSLPNQTVGVWCDH